MDREDRWPVTHKQKLEVVTRLMEIIRGDQAELSIRASEVLLALEEQNQEYDFSLGNFGGLDDDDDEDDEEWRGYE